MCDFHSGAERFIHSYDREEGGSREVTSMTVQLIITFCL